MTVKLDRSLQLNVLQQLRDRYPYSVEVTRLPGADLAHYQANLSYLEERGLIQGSHEMGKGSPIVLAKISADGLDFLEGDGGAEAILGGKS